MTSSNAFSFADLQELAARRDYRLVRRGKMFWIVSLKTGLPEANGQALVFSFDEAKAMLLGLTEIYPGEEAASGAG